MMTISFFFLLVPLSIIITNTTKWKQDGITVFHQIDFDEDSFDLNPMYIDDNQTIYIAEISKSRIIEIKLNLKNFSIVVGGNEDGTDQLGLPIDIILEKKSDSFIICDQGNRQIVRWSRQNATNGDIIISNSFCNGLAMDDKGYLYVSDWLNNEVRQWEIGINNKSIIVAGGNGLGNNSRQFIQPTFIFVDKDYSVYVVDKSNHRIMKWMKNAKEGIVVAGGNGAGNNLTQLSSPSGIVVDHLDNIYIIDTNNDRVVRWIKGASEGSIVVGGNGKGNETNQLFLPSDLVFDKQGNLYVFDSINHRIQKFNIQSN
jgi:sugar lactone lactonase YvrE